MPSITSNRLNSIITTEKIGWEVWFKDESDIFLNYMWPILDGSVQLDWHKISENFNSGFFDVGG